MTDLDPTRRAALERLAAFVPGAGTRYTTDRNLVVAPKRAEAVSRLSPYLRYRILTEHDVVAAVLDRHRPAACEKFVQEVLWRTYWKGWLETRPSVWTRYLVERDEQRVAFADPRAVAAAEAGTTGIDGFDDWARELVATGYLHNHVRMWFASIWIFTLRLPWALGADFFLRHLLDGDAASNTLSWRWVAGLQTVGKFYLATADNIARCTGGRYSPVGLASDATALTEDAVGSPQDLSAPERFDEAERSLLLVTSDDLHPESLFAPSSVGAAIVVNDRALLWADGARTFVAGASRDAVERIAAHFESPADECGTLAADPLIAAARAAGVRQIVTAQVPVGPVATALAAAIEPLANAGISLVRVRRPWDVRFWPHARKGYFPFRERIPALLREEGVG